jgi:quercetin dioxygenase-like cupin family protein
MVGRLGCSFLLMSSLLSLQSAHVEAAGDEAVRSVFDRMLPNIPGKRLAAVEVTYPPGGRSLPHTHAPSAFIFAYVLSGTVRSQVGSEPARVFKAGESFFEAPGAHHVVSENASATEPARLLAVFVVDAASGPLTRPDQP